MVKQLKVNNGKITRNIQQEIKREKETAEKKRKRRAQARAQINSR